MRICDITRCCESLFIGSAKKLAEAADASVGPNFMMNGKFVFEVRLYSGFGDDVAFSKNYGNQD